MLFNEIVSDLFICNFIGLCKIVQNVHILLILKGQKKKSVLICLYVWNHPSYSYTNLFTGGTTRLCFAPQDLFLFNVDLKSRTASMQSCPDQLCVWHPSWGRSAVSHSPRNHCNHGSHCSFSHGYWTSFSTSSPDGNQCWKTGPGALAASWRYCPRSQIWQFPGHVLEAAIPA